MRTSLVLLLALGVALVAHALVGAPARAAPDGWYRSIEEGTTAAAKSGRPLLVVTAWRSGV